MTATDTYRKQHAELIEIVRSIEPMLDPAKVATATAEARNLISKLLGKLSIHLAMEDQSLYPRLVQHADLSVREIAKKFATEMAGVKPSVESFGKKWTENELRANPAAFCNEARKLFALLGDRIQRENTQLYPLLDKAG
jgi:iron-sulfur cluster repair protein YtfE (RIC family)